MACLFRIPGNIKQQLQPFVYDKQGIADYAENSQALKGKKPQVFTYKSPATTKSGATTSTNAAVIGICPKSFQNMINDISYRYLYPFDSTVGKTLPSEFNVATLLNSLPGLQIREYLPDTRLDQVLGFASELWSAFTSLKTNSKDKTQSTTNTAQKNVKDDQTLSWTTKLTLACGWIAGYITGANKNENLFKDFGDSYPPQVKNALSYVGSLNEDLQSYIFKFPFLLYYCFQTLVTTNIYEIPGFPENDQIFASTGSPGWNGGSSFAIVNQTANMLPGIGPWIKSWLGNIRIQYLPFWDSDQGTHTEEPEITVKLNLFNDTIDTAVNNYIFVTTLIGNNKWIQYNMFQHSSSLYDVKIHGSNRIFAATGDFTVTCKGVLRDPPTDFYTALMKHKNAAYSFAATDLMANKIIKIPDVYQLELKFKSILPANFNNYLYSIVSNKSIIDDTTYSGNAYQESDVEKLFKDAMTKFGSKFKSHWDSSNW